MVSRQNKKFSSRKREEHGRKSKKRGVVINYRKKNFISRHKFSLFLLIAAALALLTPHSYWRRVSSYLRSHSMLRGMGKRTLEPSNVEVEHYNTSPISVNASSTTFRSGQKLKNAMIRPEFPPLPNPKPFLESAGTGRQNPVFKFSEFAYHKFGDRKGGFYKQAEFVVGNKSVVVRRVDGRNRPDQDQSVQIYIDKKQVGRIMWWGSFKGGGCGYPFKNIPNKPATMRIDRNRKMVIWSKPYITPYGDEAVFTYRLRGLKDSKIELSWNLGVSESKAKKAPTRFDAELWFTDKAYRGKRLTFGGDKWKQSNLKTLKQGKKSTPVSGDFVYNAGDPLRSYSILFGDLSGSVTEDVKILKARAPRYGMCYRTHNKSTHVSGKVIIDLGEARLLSNDTPPAVGGIDFWNINGTHVPLPATRNIMPNPSFEQGLRYWTWVGGGACYTPGSPPRHEVIRGGMFGQHALILRSTQHGGPGMHSFPLPLENGQTYTLSFYAKADKTTVLKVTLMSAARGGKFVGKWGPFGDLENPDCRFTIGTGWKRYSRTFTADASGVCVGLFGDNNTMIDAIQLEKGTTPTNFVAPPLDGWVVTSNPDNSLDKGAPIDAALEISGKANTKGMVTVTVWNAYREVRYKNTFAVTVGGNGTVKVPLAFNAKKLGEGIFVVRVDYSVKGIPSYTDYYRFDIMIPLHNTHATKDIFGTLGHYARLHRGDDIAKRYRRWGFGSTSWGYSHGNAMLRPMLEKKYGIANYCTVLTNCSPWLSKSKREWGEITPEMEKRIEDIAYKEAKERDPNQYYTWAFGNEEEGGKLIRAKKFDEYFKAQYATAKGVKRAMPNAQILPTCGTSGYSRLRGYNAMEGYLRSAKKHGFKYDGIAVHPYGNIDKGILSKNDLDEETARLIAQMQRFGYGEETPIYYTEMFNIPETYIPAWNANWAYDSYQAGKVTYDFGNREFIQAASVARAWIICLKYWPHLVSTNIWVARPFMDEYLTPLLICKVANTLGHNMGYVKYYADVKPAAGIRGYVFKLKDGSAIAPMWCINHDVENGFKRGPVVDVKFEQPVRFIDLMGNPRSAPTDDNGTTKVQLTPAPILIKAKNIKLLATALRNAISNDAASSLKVTVNPSVSGSVMATLKNLTGRIQKGHLLFGGKSIDYKVAGGGVLKIALDDAVGNQPGQMYKWDNTLTIQPEKGDPFNVKWNMDYFFVPYSKGMPNWNKIPGIRFTNRFRKAYDIRSAKGGFEHIKPPCGYPGDLEAVYKMAWDKNNLYLRVEAKDDKFLTFPALWTSGGSDTRLYVHDGCLEVYFDTGADGRSDESKTYDNNDYRYDFSIGKSGRSGHGMVYRLREVYHQLAGGVDMPSKEEAARKIKCDFKRTASGYTYTITFGQRYIEPLALRKGFVAGFGLFLHDRDDPEIPPGVKGFSLATKPGAHCDYNPYLWPLMVLER